MTDNAEITHPRNIFIEVFRRDSPNPAKEILSVFNTPELLLDNCQGREVDQLAELWPKFRVPWNAKGRELVQFLQQLGTKFGWSGCQKTLVMAVE